MATSKVLAEFATYDPHDLAKIGYDVQLYADGRVAATKWSRWQGSMTRTRYVADGAIDVSKIDPNDPDNDAEATLSTWWQRNGEDVEWPNSSTWRKVRPGYKVQ